MKIALIPAKTNSRRCPGKNFRNFKGRPVVNRSLDAIFESQLFDSVVVSTDNEKALDYIDAKFLEDRHEIFSLYIREEYLCGPDVPLFDVLKNYYNQCISGTHLPESDIKICLVYPCAPLITAKMIKDCFRDFEEKYNEDDCFISYPVVKRGQPINKDLVLNNGVLSPKEASLHDNDHDDCNVYMHTGLFFWLDPIRVIESGRIVQPTKSFIVLKDYETQDINTEEDWEDANTKYDLLNNRYYSSNAESLMG